MPLYPVIMCGGSGTRLWPSSRPSRPKQFMPLAGEKSLFQQTAARVAPLCEGGEIIVVAGVAHRAAILEQLAGIGLSAQLILEPEGRDSAPAIAAAAAWTARRSPGAINVVVASDHYIPDADAFRLAVQRASAAARDGRIVTLGVQPSEPSSAYGYIAPSGAGLSEVRAFVEKPDRWTAERYVEEGYLWNSGNFIASASTLLDALDQHAPLVLKAAVAGLGETDAPILVLGPAFAAAPRISIDYAVLEKTDRACVLAVSFDWSDLGSWDAIARTGQGDQGLVLREDAENCLVRACDGVVVAAVGVRDLAIVVERDAVLVCDLSRSQGIKRIVDRLKTVSPGHLEFGLGEIETLQEGGARFSDWLRVRALPVWCTVGQDARGAFAETLSPSVRAIPSPRRARVQARQIHVFAEAGLAGWSGPWRPAVTSGLIWLDAHFLNADGRMRAVLTTHGQPLDHTALLYDQAFLLLALASAHRALDMGYERRAVRLRDGLLADAPSTGGLIEGGSHPFQSNAHMHLLEACLAWEAAGAEGQWAALADRIVGHARDRLIDQTRGCVREFFDADWAPAPGEEGRRAEPGHQFEWAWLLARYARARSDTTVLEEARRLYAFGLRGVDARGPVALDALDEDGAVVDARARLWPQTEWFKAAMILAESVEGAERERLLEEAAQAQRATAAYLTRDGIWRDQRQADGCFVDEPEPAPASSLYHLMGAWAQGADTARRLGLPGSDRLTLA